MDKDQALIDSFQQTIRKEGEKSNDGKAAREEQAYDIEQLRAQSFAQDIRERKKFAQWIFWMVVGWLISIIAIVILVGFKILVLSDAIVLGLIGSTTVNITTFFLVVTKYLFPSSKLET